MWTRKFCLPFSEAKLNEDNKKYLQRYLDVTKSQMFLQGEFYL